MKPVSKLSVWIVATFSAILFIGSRSKENARRQQLKNPDKNTVKRPGKLESMIGATLHFLLDI